MLDALHTTAELLAIGLGLEKDALTSLMHQGPHLLGPTGEHMTCRSPALKFLLPAVCIIERFYLTL